MEPADALAAALHAHDHPAWPDCFLGLNVEPRPEWAGTRKCENDATAILAALTASGWEVRPALDAGMSNQTDIASDPPDVDQDRHAQPAPEPDCCELACYEDPGCMCDGCQPQPAPDALRVAARAALDILPDLSVAYHQTGSIRDHADPNDRTGWNVHGIETCDDVYCTEAQAAIAALRAAIEEADR